MSEAIEALNRAITTAMNDDMSRPGTDKRLRANQRVIAMSRAQEEIERLTAENEALRKALLWYATLGEKARAALKDPAP